MESSAIHKDHRKRMRERFRQNGISSFSEHEILEMLLYSVIPRKNTNPIAHDLLDKFGDLHGVLSAEKYELCEIEGIGETVADHLVFLGYAFSDITTSLLGNVVLDTEDRIGMYAVMQMGIAQSDSAVAVYLDKNSLPISSEWLYRGKTEMTDRLSVYICDRAKDEKAVAVILMHNHRKEPLIPSAEDTLITKRLRENAAKIGIKKVWHVITSEEGYIFI